MKESHLNSSRIVHIHFANIDFNCPYCNKSYQDTDDKYLDRCNKNKNGCATIKCECSQRFGMTYDMMCDAVAFKLETK